MSKSGLEYYKSVINVLIKVMLNEIRCRGTLQSQWSTLTESTNLKAEESVNVMHILIEWVDFNDNCK